MPIELMEKIAASAGDWAVQRYAAHKSKSKQLRLWSKFHDSALASLYAYEELRQAHAIRIRATFSDN